jgi:hypothetical protein
VSACNGVKCTYNSNFITGLEMLYFHPCSRVLHDLASERHHAPKTCGIDRSCYQESVSSSYQWCSL